MAVYNSPYFGKQIDDAVVQVSVNKKNIHKNQENLGNLLYLRHGTVLCWVIIRSDYTQ